VEPAATGVTAAKLEKHLEVTVFCDDASVLFALDPKNL
jgi:hypothetical protein